MHISKSTIFVPPCINIERVEPCINMPYAQSVVKFIT